MAPEQAEGRSREVGPATDVYALGAIMYQALTGRPPFQGEARSAVLEQVRGQLPVPPRRLRPSLSAELEAVCLKCLEKQPAARYESAEALADDLGRWLRGEPTAARPPGRARRALRWLRRRRLWVAAALVTAAGVIVATLLWPKDRNKPVKEIEARLARGEAVTLIGPAGGPAWSQFAEGEQEATTAAARDGTFAVHSSSSLALVELVRNPPPPYRLRAWVRHDRTDPQGAVGVYVAHRLYDSRGGPVHHFGALTFNDLHKVSDDAPGVAEPGGKLALRPKLNPLFLGPHLYAQGGARPWEPLSGIAVDKFEPAGFGRGDFREVAVEVTADGVQGFWAGRPARRPVPIRLWQQRAEDPQKYARRERLDEPFAEGYEPRFTPAGGLGLFAHRGSASFHSVAVEPIGPD
jgi:serine/threonine-protein kinase